MSKDDNMAGAHDYMTHVSDAASFEAYQRQEPDARLSAETLDASNSLIDFKAFAQEYPDKLLPLLAKLRPEFQELFAEYWLLGKSQSFIGKVHGFIQTRVWQNLRIIEQSIGSLILLGTNPDAEIIRPILEKARLDVVRLRFLEGPLLEDQYGSLTDMIVLYASTQNYVEVALNFRMPVPAVRKIFRPAIASLLANKDVKAVAVGAYLRSLTHQASLTGAGLSKRCKARNRRVKVLRFSAPPTDNSPLLSFNRTETLGDMPWAMFEISSDHRMEQIAPTLLEQGRKIFGKKAAQIFAPLTGDGELEFGYLFARSASPALTRRLTKIRGIGEMATVCNSEGEFVHAVDVPNNEVQTMIAKHNPSAISKVRVGDFVEVLTGDARGYCGIVTSDEVREFMVQVSFPTGRCFLIHAAESSVKKLPRTPMVRRAFWGILNS